MDYLSASWTAVCYIAYPIFYIVKSILLVLVTITAPLLHLLLHLGHYCLYACWYALSVLGKFEASLTLYVFFGIAALVGIVTGTSLHYLSGFIISVLNLDPSPEIYRGRTLAAYRAGKQERQDAKDPIMKVRQKDQGFRKKNLGLMEDYTNWNPSKQDRAVDRFNTILEEEDSSDGF